MFARCSNRNCVTDFDYREGRFFRFFVRHQEGKAPRNGHPVRHFWLCKKCSESYMLQYQDDQCVLVRRRMDLGSGKSMVHAVAAV